MKIQQSCAVEWNGGQFRSAVLCRCVDRQGEDYQSWAFTSSRDFGVLSENWRSLYLLGRGWRARH